MTSCATYYTKGPDTINKGRYQHDEKILTGMTMKEVMDRFGSPQLVEKRYHSQWVIEFTYYRSLYCTSIYCFVRFDLEDKKVVDYINFRQEFTDLVSYK